MKNRGIYVEWYDPCGKEDGWIDVPDISRKIPLVKTLGFLFEENKQNIIVCLSRGTKYGSEVNEELLGFILIHKNLIKKRKWIKI